MSGPHRPPRQAVTFHRLRGKEPYVEALRAPTSAGREDPFGLGDEPGLLTDLAHDGLRVTR
jgi:hypothetical protein